MKKRIISILAFTISIALFSSCGGGGSNPNAGFKILTYALSPTGNGAVVPTAGRVQGQFLSANSNATGTVTSFNANHSGVGYLVINSARVPGTWRLTLSSDFGVPGSLCLNPNTIDRGVSLNDEVRLYCVGRFLGFAASPDVIDVQNPPATVEISGEGIEESYGTPMVAFYDSFGNVAASTPVSQINGKTGVTVSVPQLNLAYNGTYTVVVHNIMSDGSWDAVGATLMTVFGNPPPPGGGGGGGDPGGCPPQDPNREQLPCDMQNQ